MNQLIAKSLLVAGKAALHILPEVQPQEEPTELDCFSMAAFMVMSTNEYQAMPESKKLQFQSAMKNALGVFFEEEGMQEEPITE